MHARDALEAVRARVLEQDGVTDCYVRDNSTAASVTVQAIAIAARSLLVIAEGGASSDIAAAIAATKPAGTPTVRHGAGAGSAPTRLQHPDPIPARRPDPLDGDRHHDSGGRISLERPGHHEGQPCRLVRRHVAGARARNFRSDRPRHRREPRPGADSRRRSTPSRGTRSRPWWSFARRVERRWGRRTWISGTP